MAWIFGLNAECGPSGAHACELARHFHGWPTGIYRDAENWWCGVFPDGLSRSGITSDADAAAMTAAGHRLYERLLTAPPVYRYALAGVETDEFHTYDELTVDPANPWICPGLVLGDDVWATLGKPAAYGPFAPGYRWVPYRGESRS